MNIYRGNVSSDRFYGINNERWIAAVRSVPLKGASRVAFEGFLYGLRGPMNTTVVKDEANRRLVSSFWPAHAGGSALSLSANTSVMSEFMTVNGISMPDGSEAAIPGGIFSLQNTSTGLWEMYKVRGATPVSSGSVQLTVWPRVRSVHVIGENLEIANPVVSMRLLEQPSREVPSLNDATVVYSFTLRQAS